MNPNFSTWITFLNTHEAMSLLRAEDTEFYPVDSTVILIYGGFVLKKIVMDSVNESVMGYNFYNQEESLLHSDPNDTVTFTKIID
jgi:hypothetical protein